MLNIAILPLLVVGFVVLLLVFAGVIALEVFLSKRESKWLGLILPIITFLLSLVPVVRMVLDNVLFNSLYLVKVGIVLLVGNIPTIVLLGVYLACREKIDRQSQLDKMNIQDLD